MKTTSVLFILFALTLTGTSKGETNETLEHRPMSVDYVQFDQDTLRLHKLGDPVECLTRILNENGSKETNDYLTVGLKCERSVVPQLEAKLATNPSPPINDQLYFALTLLGERQHVQGLLNGLARKIPEYESVMSNKNGVVDENRICGELLKLLSDYGYVFSREEIDQLVIGFDHPNPSVFRRTMDIFINIFGMRFYGGDYDKLHTSPERRARYSAAYKEFWKQNRSRYGQHLPLIINDLEFRAKYVDIKGDDYFELELVNHGDRTWQIIVELPGEPNKSNPAHLIDWGSIFSFKSDKGGSISPIPSKAIQLMYSAKVLHPNEISRIPDRPVHLEKIPIARGSSYMTRLNLSQAFPDLDLRGKTITMIYSDSPDEFHGSEASKWFDSNVWQGKLKANPMTVPLRSTMKSE